MHVQLHLEKRGRNTLKDYHFPTTLSATSGKYKTCRPIGSWGQLMLSALRILFVSKMVWKIGFS